MIKTEGKLAFPQSGPFKLCCYVGGPQIKPAFTVLSLGAIGAVWQRPAASLA